MMSRVKVSLPSGPGFSMMPSTADSPQFMIIYSGLREAQLVRRSNTRLDGLDMLGLIWTDLDWLTNAKFL